MEYVAENVADLLRNTSSEAQHPLNVAFLAELFQKPANAELYLCNSSLYERAKKEGGSPSGTKAEQQLSAKLHCLYGVPILYPRRTICKPVYPYATSKVYDLRQYTEKTFWGPFLDDGSQDVDWEKVEAIMVVLGHNLQIFPDRTNGAFKPIWTDPFSGATPGSYKSPSLSVPEGPPLSLDFIDPYNITGTWMRVSSPFLFPRTQTYSYYRSSVFLVSDRNNGAIPTLRLIGQTIPNCLHTTFPPNHLHPTSLGNH